MGVLLVAIILSFMARAGLDFSLHDLAIAVVELGAVGLNARIAAARILCFSRDICSEAGPNTRASAKVPISGIISSQISDKRTSFGTWVAKGGGLGSCIGVGERPKFSVMLLREIFDLLVWSNCRYVS